MDYQLLEILRQNGLRSTKARHAVFIVFKAESAMTMQELSAKTASSLDTASLYRTLNLYRELGIVHDVVIAGQRKIELTDVFSPHHHHLACSSCGKTVVIHREALEAQITALTSAHGFTHEAHSFEITGLCPECQPH